MTDTPVPAHQAARFERRRMFTFLCMVFGMFMAILDIQIVSASLTDIQAGLSAAADEISWVQTSYLIAEVVMIPLSGFLSRLMSTRWLFVASAAGFTLMSFMCATASTLGEMIVYRGLQGFIGGGMIPTVFAAAFTIFPPSKRALVSPIIGLVATLAPTIGPTIGGWLTDMFSWHWLFLINIVPGVFVTISTWRLIDFDEPHWALFDQFDWLGLVSMAGFLGGLEYVLEEGATNDWFNDRGILICAVVCVVSAVVFFWRALTRTHPIVDLWAFTNRNFTVGCAFSFMMGIGLYGLTYLYPVFLGRVRGYSALQIGETLFLTGVCMFVTAPIAGKLATRLDPRLMIGTGFVGFAAGTFLVTGITRDWGFGELVLPQVLRGVSLMLCMVTINNIALGTLPPERMKNASGLFNLTRNLGGAVGLAIINTQINDRWDLHLQRLREAVTWSRGVALERIDALTRTFQDVGVDAASRALKTMANMVRQQALVMAFADVFLMLTVLFLLMACVTPLIRKASPPPGAPRSGH
jgi:DHA2 family multidrug resistance protein